MLEQASEPVQLCKLFTLDAVIGAMASLGTLLDDIHTCVGFVVGVGTHWGMLACLFMVKGSMLVGVG